MVFAEFGLSLAYTIIAYVAVYYAISRPPALTLITFSLTRLQTFSDLVQIKVRLAIGYYGTAHPLLISSQILSACMNIFAAVPDVAIASILCTILYQSRTGSSKSNMLINRLVSNSRDAD